MDLLWPTGASHTNPAHTVKAAGAGIHGCDKHEAGGQRDAVMDPGNAHLSGLDRFPKSLERVSRKLRQLVEE